MLNWSLVRGQMRCQSRGKHWENLAGQKRKETIALVENRCTDMITWQERQIEDCGSTQCQTHSWREKPVNPTAARASPSSVFLPSLSETQNTWGKQTATSNGIKRALKGHSTDFTPDAPARDQEGHWENESSVDSWKSFQVFKKNK